MINIHEAILKLNPSVVTIRGDEAFDAEGNPVVYDKDAAKAWVDPNAYKEARVAEYPPFVDYLDGIVKGDDAQVQKYIADCQAVISTY